MPINSCILLEASVVFYTGLGDSRIPCPFSVFDGSQYSVTLCDLVARRWSFFSLFEVVLSGAAWDALGMSLITIDRSLFASDVVRNCAFSYKVPLRNPFTMRMARTQ